MRSMFAILALALCVGCAAPSSSFVSPIAPSASSVDRSSVVLDQPRLLQPDSVLADQFAGQLDRAIRKAFRETGPAALIRRAVGDVVVVPISTRPAGVYIFPDVGANQVLVPQNATQASLAINIALADKLAVGKTLNWAIYFSADSGATWVLRTRGFWTSYGPGGFTNPFTGEQNADPKILLPDLVPQRGQFIRGVLTLDQSIDAGATMNVQ